MTELSTEDFEKEVINSEATVLVEFTADWCGICKRSEKLMNAVEREFSDVKFCFVDIEKDKELAGKFSVKGVPTTLVFKGGELSKRKTGALTKGELYSMLGKKTANL